MSDYTILEVLGYKLADGSFGPRAQARESGATHFARYARARCLCGVEKIIQIRSAVAPAKRCCASCAAKLRHGTDRFSEPVCLTCGGKLNRRRNKYCSIKCSKVYSKEEENYLHGLYIYPAEVAIDSFKKFLSLNRLPQKSRKTIASKFAALGIKFEYEETHFTREKLCTFLGIPRHRGAYIKDTGAPFKRHRNRFRIATKSLREWLVWNKNKALLFPYFDGCDLPALEYLLGGDLFTQYQRWESRGLIRPLACKSRPITVEGVAYPSITQASKAVPMSYSALKCAANGTTKNCSLRVEDGES